MNMHKYMNIKKYMNMKKYMKRKYRCIIISMTNDHMHICIQIVQKNIYTNMYNVVNENGKLFHFYRSWVFKK